MEFGTGLFVFGAWMCPVAALLAPRVTNSGVATAYSAAWLATLIGLAVTFGPKLASLA